MSGTLAFVGLAKPALCVFAFALLPVMSCWHLYDSLPGLSADASFGGPVDVAGVSPPPLPSSGFCTLRPRCPRAPVAINRARFFVAGVNLKKVNYLCECDEFDCAPFVPERSRTCAVYVHLDTAWPKSIVGLTASQFCTQTKATLSDSIHSTQLS